MKKASIDLGTNTALLLIAERDEQGGVRIIEDYAETVRLGEGVDQTRELHPDAMKRALDCLKKYSENIKKAGLNPSHAIAVATSQARDAKNGLDFFKTVETQTGLKFRILSGDQEALYTFKGGLLPGMDPKTSAVIDIGGGSTEFMSLLGGQSLDLGGVRFTERFLRAKDSTHPVTDEQFWNCQAQIDQLISPLIEWRKKLNSHTQLVAVAGTPTSLASWYLELPEWDARRVDQVTLTRGDIHRMVEELKWRSVDERKKLPGMDPKRADIILAGSLILWRAMEILDFKDVRVSTRGLRFGILGLDSQ